MKKAPDRERWIGWVALAWMLAAVAVIGGIAAVSMAGFIEVARPNSFGRMETAREPNVFIWAIAIGQAVSALMLAAIFSMINSIYKNSCDQLSAVIAPTDKQAGLLPESEMEGEVEVEGDWDGTGLKILSVHSASQLRGILKGGYVLTKVNNESVSSSLQAASAVSEGRNTIEYVDNNGAMKRRALTMKAAPLYIQFEK